MLPDTSPLALALVSIPVGSPTKRAHSHALPKLNPTHVMKSLLSLSLLSATLLASCSSLPQEEIEALVTFREGEITRLTTHTSILTATVETLEAQIVSIDTRIQNLKEDRARTLNEKMNVQAEIETTKVLIEENQERLEELRD